MFVGQRSRRDPVRLGRLHKARPTAQERHRARARHTRDLYLRPVLDDGRD